ncbi:ATPase [Micromonospora sp. NPDC049679]|uniref:ATPase n=1 Tax=Micromonospora sp. NPDC049679 TaxID=3155920 RepID=UPI0033E696F6
MEFSGVELGYDREQVDHCLEDLGDQLEKMTAEARAAAAADAELALVREEVTRLRRMLRGRPAVYRTSVRLHHMLELAQEEAAEIVAQAHEELAAARREAAELRDRAYNEAVQARRDFEAALQARRRREQEVDVILRRVVISDGVGAAGDVADVPLDDPHAAPTGGRVSTCGSTVITTPESAPPSRDETIPADSEGTRRTVGRWPRIRSRMISAGR